MRIIVKLATAGRTRVGDVLVVNRFRVPSDEAESFRADLEAALAVLARQRGYADGQLGRNVDDPSSGRWSTRWADVGSYRRALSSYDVKVGAVALLGRAARRAVGVRAAGRRAQRARCHGNSGEPASSPDRLGPSPTGSQPGAPLTGAPPWPRRPPSAARQRRLPRQAPGFRLPVRRDLRRHPVGLGLRPARCRAQGEHQAPVVALDGAVPRGRRRPRLQRDPADARPGRPPATSRRSPTR